MTTNSKLSQKQLAISSFLAENNIKLYAEDPLSDVDYAAYIDEFNEEFKDKLQYTLILADLADVHIISMNRPATDTEQADAIAKLEKENKTYYSLSYRALSIDNSASKPLYYYDNMQVPMFISLIINLYNPLIIDENKFSAELTFSNKKDFNEVKQLCTLINKY